jgi:hypothetical protein
VRLVLRLPSSNDDPFDMLVRIACRRTALVLAALAFATTGAADDVASVTAEPKSPEWAEMNAMQLSLSVSDEPSPLEYTVVPLTENLGLNMTGTAREVIQFSGELKIAAPSNYLKIHKPNDIAYLSCDTPSDDTLIGPNKMLNELMQAEPKAIILYSISGNWCQLHASAPLDYTAILSMADSSEVPVVLKKLNSANSKVVATINGNNTLVDTEDQGGPGKSSVAMSILYTITGLVTLLFVVIIATGAVRAHRYPERYGPRGAGGGRPRQSRAKGIARAVLDTIPIVKFGNPSPAKPDPELELETGTTDSHETGTQRTDSRVSRETSEGAGAVGRNDSKTPGVAQTSETGQAEGEAPPGCTICTEDFKVGEDVRVLPCNHQYHPNCVDPWLINISGTCPLW